MAFLVEMCRRRYGVRSIGKVDSDVRVQSRIPMEPAK
jgi:hypothetical protein